MGADSRLVWGDDQVGHVKGDLAVSCSALLGSDQDKRFMR